MIFHVIQSSERGMFFVVPIKNTSLQLKKKIEKRFGLIMWKLVSLKKKEKKNISIWKIHYLVMDIKYLEKINKYNYIKKILKY